MKVFELNEKERIYFKDMDLFGLLDAGSRNPDLSLGIVHEEEEGAVPAGLLLGQAENEALTLFWLFVDPSYRGKSYGENLLSYAFRYAEEAGYRELHAVFPEDSFGYDLICKNDRLFLRNHGFLDTDDGGMKAEVSAYPALSEMRAPDLYVEGNMIELLLIEEEGAPAYDGEEVSMLTPGSVKVTSIGEFARLPNLHSFFKKVFREKKELQTGSIGELTLPLFREGLELCESNGHTGYLKSLLDTPLEHYDLEVSSYTMSDGRVTGLMLFHYDEGKDQIIAELFFSADKENLISLAEMLRCSLLAAGKKYDKNTKIVLPYEEDRQLPFISRLFGE